MSFGASLKLRKPIVGEDCPDAVKGVAEYSLLATVSHHGKHAAGEDEFRACLPLPYPAAFLLARADVGALHLLHAAAF